MTIHNPIPGNAPGMQSPIMALFAEWKAVYEWLDQAVAISDEAGDGVCDKLQAIEARIMAEPPTSAQDVYAKLVAWSSFGDFNLDGPSAEPFWAEARAMVPWRARDVTPEGHESEGA